MEQASKITYINEINHAQNACLAINHCSLYRFLWSWKTAWCVDWIGQLDWEVYGVSPSSVGTQMASIISVRFLVCQPPPLSTVILLILVIKIERNHASENCLKVTEPLHRWYLFILCRTLGYMGRWHSFYIALVSISKHLFLLTY